MSGRPRGYIPAAGHDWLLPLYDPLLRILFPEEAAKRQLAEAARIGARDRQRQRRACIVTLAGLLLPSAVGCSQTRRTCKPALLATRSD